MLTARHTTPTRPDCALCTHARVLDPCVAGQENGQVFVTAAEHDGENRKHDPGRGRDPTHAGPHILRLRARA